MREFAVRGTVIEGSSGTARDLKAETQCVRQEKVSLIDWGSSQVTSERDNSIDNRRVSRRCGIRLVCVGSTGRSVLARHNGLVRSRSLFLLLWTAI